MSEQLYRDCTGDPIEVGFLVTHPGNVNAAGKPVVFKGIAVVVGRHDETNDVFVRYMGKDMVHQVHAARLQIISPSARNRTAVSVPSLATAA